MTYVAFRTLEDAISDDQFPRVDLLLRRGVHISRDNADAYEYLIEAKALLDPFYQRYACTLFHATDGYFYLVPSGDLIKARQLVAADMLVGIALAKLYLDPKTIATDFVVPATALKNLLGSHFGDHIKLATIIDDNRRYKNTNAAETFNTKHLTKALRTLADLGFIEIMNHPINWDSSDLRLRPSLMRFADAVRTTKNIQDALTQLMIEGRVDLTATPHETDDDTHTDSDTQDATP